MRYFFIQIKKKEEFTSLGGISHLTGKVLTEWRSFGSYKEAQKACEDARNDEKVVEASVVSPEFERVDDFYV